MWVQQEERGVKPLTVWVWWKRSEGRKEQCGCSRKGVKTLTVWARWKKRKKNNVSAAGREGVKPLTVWVWWKRSEGREEKCSCSRKGGGGH